MDTGNIPNFLENCYEIKPKRLKMNELEWKLLIRSILKGKNIVLTGPTGCGKTLSVYCAVESLKIEDRFFEFNLGSSQDPRGFLIGNTHFDKNSGTFFTESEFVRAIRTPNAFILLDELTRAHPEAHNILMTVLDDQKYLRLDEKSDKEKVKVADGVCFVATANIGPEYTATRVIDRAILDRFQKIEIKSLTQEEEFDLMKFRFPDGDFKEFEKISQISSGLRDFAFSEDGSISNFISTRHALEMAELSVDGFNLMDICRSVVFPMFDAGGGIDSERTFVKQFVQRFFEDDSSSSLPFNVQNSND